MSGRLGRGLNAVRVSRGLAAFLLLLWCGEASAFQVLKTTRGLNIKWAGTGATFFINGAGSPAGSLGAMQASLQTWSDLPAALFSFTYGGTTAATSFSTRDGVNNIGFGPLAEPGVIALATFWYNAGTGAFEDVDIQFNTNLVFSTNGDVNAYDVQEIGTHELGHAVGLADLFGTGDVEKTMYGFGLKGETKKRTLDQDDKDGVAFLYPGTAVVVATGDFDADGREDLADYHPASGNWYFLTAAGPSRTQFGFAGTIPVTGDFDGDGSADIGVYHPPSGMWYFLRSNAGYAQAQFGFAGTTPVVADFDGDGRSDHDVYHPATGGWYLMQSSDGFRQLQFGFAGTIPVSGDFDRDGKADIGVYHPPSGMWYLMQSRDGYREQQFGFAGTTPVVADFDGDGTSDTGVYYPPTGTWYVLQSSAGYREQQFGFAGTTPVSGDFDGDGEADIGVYHPASGSWYLLKSSEGFLQTLVTL